MSDPIDFKVEHVTAPPGGVDLVRITLSDGPRYVALIDMTIGDFALACLTSLPVTASLERRR